MKKSILDDLQYRGVYHSNKLFLSWNFEDITYGEFFSRVRKAVYWIKRSGLKPDERVALCVSDHLDYLSFYFASMAVGAIPVLLWPDRKKEDFEYACDHVEASLLITDHAELDGCISVPVLCIPANWRCYPEEWSESRSDVAHMMFTSGTTSRPKAVMCSHENNLFITDTLMEMAQMKPLDHEVLYMPLYSTGGLGHINALIRRGASARLLPCSLWSIDDRYLSKILEIVENEKVTGFLTTITLLDRLRSSHRQEFLQRCKNLKFIAVNIAPLPPELVADLISLVPETRLCHYYGATEASRSVYQRFNENPGKYGCSGKPAPGVRLWLRNVDPKTGIGEVVVRGPNVMLGYWSERFQKKSDPRCFYTGDLGIIDEDGFLTIKGRVKDNISVDGKRFLPGEVEAVLKEHPLVKDCAVVALSDPRTFQKPGAAIVLKDEACSESMARELYDLCCIKLGSIKAPKSIAMVKRLPRSEQGKIQRKEITRDFEAGALSMTTFAQTI